MWVEYCFKLEKFIIILQYGCLKLTKNYYNLTMWVSQILLLPYNVCVSNFIIT